MPPRPQAARQPLDVPTWDLTGRHLKLVASTPPEQLEAEPSPLLEALQRYLDTLE